MELLLSLLVGCGISLILFYRKWLRHLACTCRSSHVRSTFLQDHHRGPAVPRRTAVFDPERAGSQDDGSCHRSRDHRPHHPDGTSAAAAGARAAQAAAANTAQAGQGRDATPDAAQAATHAYARGIATAFAYRDRSAARSACATSARSGARRACSLGECRTACSRYRRNRMFAASGHVSVAVAPDGRNRQDRGAFDHGRDRTCGKDGHRHVERIDTPGYGGGQCGAGDALQALYG